MISIFLNLLRLIYLFIFNLTCILETVSSVLEKNVYSAAVAMMGVGSVFYICLLDSFGLDCCSSSFADLLSEYSAAAAALLSHLSCVRLCETP